MSVNGFTFGDDPTIQKYNYESLDNIPDIENGTYPNMAVGSIIGSNKVTDTEPYFLRPSASIGDREYDEIVGGTLGWNQLCNGSSVTVESGHKYYMIKGGAKSVGASDGTAITGLTSGTDIVIDITTLFGSTIADYIYSLEQATAGAGVAWFRQYFGKDYYPYSAPTLKSVEGLTAHEMVGFNQWDEESEAGDIDTNTGANKAGLYMRSKNYIPIIPGASYYFCHKGGNIRMYLFAYDGNKNFLKTAFSSSGYGTIWANDPAFVLPDNVRYIRFVMDSTYGTTYNHDICINLHWDGEKDGQYEPYVKHSYPLDSSWVGRGIPKLDSANKLYFDGDTYAADGTVTRRYGVVDLGTLDWYYRSSDGLIYSSSLSNAKGYANTVKGNLIAAGYETVARDNIFDSNNTISMNNQSSVCINNTAYTDAATFKTAMSGVMLVYELATPTEETAEPYTSPQIVDDFGTEEYVTDSIVPVGHNTKYPENLATKISSLPSLPTEAGTYRLKVAVTAGKASYEWVSA